MCTFYYPEEVPGHSSRTRIAECDSIRNWPWVIWCFASAWLAAWSGTGAAQVRETSTPGPLFQHEEPLRLRLETSLSTVTRNRANQEYQPAQLSYTAPNGETVAMDLRVRARGKSRREVCSFPPLLLNFRTNTLTETLFERQNRLKLVTHCEPREANAQYVFLEHPAIAC